MDVHQLNLDVHDLIFFVGQLGLKEVLKVFANNKDLKFILKVGIFNIKKSLIKIDIFVEAFSDEMVYDGGFDDQQIFLKLSGEISWQWFVIFGD